MLRILAAAGVLAGAGGIGLGRSASLSEEVRLFRSFLDGLRVLESEIRGLLAPLPVAMRAAGAYDKLFCDAALYMEEEAADTAFLRAAASEKGEKREVLAAFAAGLTSPDKEGQLQNIAVCRARMEALLQKAEEKRQRQGRVHTAAGLLCGMALVILFL